MFLLVSCMSTHNHVLDFARFCAGSTLKIANRNILQRTLPGFITIPSIDYGSTASKTVPRGACLLNHVTKERFRWKPQAQSLLGAET